MWRGVRSSFVVLGLVSLSLVACSAAPDDPEASATGADAHLSLGAYDPSAAVAYADAHWSDGHGLCAEFTSRSLDAGHLGIGVIPYVPNLVAAMSSIDFEEHTHGDHASISAAQGDVVVYSNKRGSKFCASHGSDEFNCGHVCIVTVAGTTETGIEVDCHNNAHKHLGMGYIMGGGYSTYRIYHVKASAPAADPEAPIDCSVQDCSGDGPSPDPSADPTAGQ